MGAAVADPALLESIGEEEWVARLGERVRQLALGLTTALVTARAYWPSEPDLKAEAGTGLDWSLALLLVTGLALLSPLIGGQLRLRRSWTDLAVVVLVCLVGYSVAHAVGRRLAINLAWEWASVGLAYLLVRNLPRTRGESEALAWALLATAVAVAIYGLYQVVVELPQLRAFYRAHPAEALRMAGITPGTPAQLLYEHRLLSSNEPMSTFALTNSLAGFLVAPLVLALAIGWEAQHRRDRGGSRFLALLLAAVPALAMLVCLILTKSRSAYLGLIVAVAVLAWRARRSVRRRTLILTGLGALIVVAGLVTVGLATRRLDREVLTEAGKSLRFRQEYWVGAWRVITSSSRAFWQGVGPGNFAAPYLQHKLPQASEEIHDPHNLFLEAWATAGFPAALALLAAVMFGLWNLLRPSTGEKPPDVEGTKGELPPRRSGWWVGIWGCGGLLAVLLVGGLRLGEGDLFMRWVILGGAWLWGVLLALPLARRAAIPVAGLGAGVLALVVNLLAAGGIGFSSVALMLWVSLALGLNLREDRPCGRLREVGGRLEAFGLAVIWAALLGTFAGGVGPFWGSEAAITEAEAAIVQAEAAMSVRPPDLDRAEAAFDRAESAFDRAIRADQYSARPWLGLAYLEYEIWRSRGSRTEDQRWKKVPVLLLKAASLPRNPNSWTLHRDRAIITGDLIDQIGPHLPPTELIRLRGNVVEATRTATRLNPTSALLHAQLALASAEIGMMPDALSEAREALRLDRLTPHPDRKLPPAFRTRLEAELPNWEKAAAGPPPPSK